MRTLGLLSIAQVVLNSSGNGTAQIGPGNPGEVWMPSVVSVGCQESTVTNEAQCKIYCGAAASQPYFVDGTLSGSTGDSSSNIAGQMVYPGQYIIAVWSGGDPGVTAFMNISGSRTVP